MPAAVSAFAIGVRFTPVAAGQQGVDLLAEGGELLGLELGALVTPNSFSSATTPALSLADRGLDLLRQARTSRRSARQPWRRLLGGIGLRFRRCRRGGRAAEGRSRGTTGFLLGVGLRGRGLLRRPAGVGAAVVGAPSFSALAASCTEAKTSSILTDMITFLWWVGRKSALHGAVQRELSASVTIAPQPVKWFLASVAKRTRRGGGLGKAATVREENGRWSMPAAL